MESQESRAIGYETCCSFIFLFFHCTSTEMVMRKLEEAGFEDIQRQEFTVSFPNKSLYYKGSE